MTDKILEALKMLQKDNDEHWTADGAPRVDVVEGLAGVEVSRADIKETAPKFNRLTMELVSAPIETPVETNPQPWITEDAADKPELTGNGANADPQTSVVTTNDADDTDGEAEALKAVEKARVAHEATGRELRHAEKVLDAFIRSRELADNNVNQSDNVKKFQEQQLEQRRQKVQQTKLLAQLVAGNK